MPLSRISCSTRFLLTRQPLGNPRAHVSCRSGAYSSPGGADRGQRLLGLSGLQVGLSPLPGIESRARNTVLRYGSEHDDWRCRRRLVLCRPEAKLSVLITAPAFYLPGIAQRTGV